MNKAFLFLMIMTSANLFAHLPIGTHDRPIPLVSVTNKLPYTIYLYNDNGYKVFHNSAEVFRGHWNLDEDFILLNPDGFAKKIYLSTSKAFYLCLEVVFYGGPAEYQWQEDIFCPR